MKDLRSPRRLIKMRQRRDKTAAVSSVAVKPVALATLSAFTASGLAVEDQVRKAWQPSSAGLPVF